MTARRKWPNEIYPFVVELWRKGDHVKTIQAQLFVAFGLDIKITQIRGIVADARHAGQVKSRTSAIYSKDVSG